MTTVLGNLRTAGGRGKVHNLRLPPEIVIGPLHAEHGDAARFGLNFAHAAQIAQYELRDEAADRATVGNDEHVAVRILLTQLDRSGKHAIGQFLEALTARGRRGDRILHPLPQADAVELGNFFETLPFPLTEGQFAPAAIGNDPHAVLRQNLRRAVRSVQVASVSRVKLDSPTRLRATL